MSNRKSQNARKIFASIQTWTFLSLVYFIVIPIFTLLGRILFPFNRKTDQNSFWKTKKKTDVTLEGMKELGEKMLRSESRNNIDLRVKTFYNQIPWGYRILDAGHGIGKLTCQKFSELIYYFENKLKGYLLNLCFLI